MMRLKRLWRYINWRLGKTDQWMVLDRSTYGKIFQDITYLDVMTNLTKPAKQQRYQFVLNTGHNAFLKLEILEWLESRGPYYIGVTIPPENNPSDYGFKVNSNHSPYYITFCHDHEASVALYKLTFL